MIARRNLHVDAAQSLVDGSRLNVRHGCQAHLIGDGGDDIRVDQSASSQVFELSDWAVLLDFLFRLSLCLCSGNLLPLCAVVEAGERGVGKAGGL